MTELKNLDFDNLSKTDLKKKVEVDVALLDYLLSYFYVGGGEPDSKNARLKLALRQKDKR